MPQIWLKITIINSSNQTLTYNLLIMVAQRAMNTITEAIRNNLNKLL